MKYRFSKCDIVVLLCNCIGLLHMFLPQSEAWPTGAPCSVEGSMTPDKNSHGDGHSWDDSSDRPPFFFQFATDDGRITPYYENGKIYRIRLTGQSTFRGFIIQARYVDPAQGKILTDYGVGQFIKSDAWEADGVKHMECTYAQTSITHANANEKPEINVRWMAPQSTQPVQFLITVVESRSFFWVKWTPREGFVVPLDWQGISGLSDLSSNQWSDQPSSSTSSTSLETQAKPYESTPTSSVSNQFKNSFESPQSGQSFSTSSTTNNNNNNYDDGYGQSKTKSFLDIYNNAETSPAISASIDSRGQQTDVKFDRYVKERLGLFEKDSCASFPCRNSGTCVPGSGSTLDGYTCRCPLGYGGKNCEFVDKCYNFLCENGHCVSRSTTAECVCEPGWGGSKCHLPCPAELCLADGECVVNDAQEYSCICKPGFTGSNCGEDIDECLNFPCQNGGTCENSVGTYACTCLPGFLGDDCDRPCVDIYGQCEGWANEHQKCILRPLTRFFDQNCPVSCKVCYPDPDVVITGPPPVPDLDVVDWLVGDWETTGYDEIHFPTPFQVSKDYSQERGFKESMKFSVSVVPAFGAPYLNYTSFARSASNFYDIQTISGFLLVEPRTKPNLKCVIKSISNTGILIIEEASIPKDKKELVFKSAEIHAMPLTRAKVPAKTRRTFRMEGSYLVYEVVMAYDDLTTSEYTNYFARESDYKYYHLKYDPISQ